MGVEEEEEREDDEEACDNENGFSQLLHGNKTGCLKRLRQCCKECRKVDISPTEELATNEDADDAEVKKGRKCNNNNRPGKVGNTQCDGAHKRGLGLLEGSVDQSVGQRSFGAFSNIRCCLSTHLRRYLV